MVRVYLDWNVISKLKSDAYADLKAYLLENKHRFLFPFTPTHFMDSEKSHGHPKFMDDLNTMTELCGEHFMQWRESNIEPLRLTPLGMFEQYKKQPHIDMRQVIDMDKIIKDMDLACNEMGQLPLGTFFKVLMKGHSVGSIVSSEGPPILEVMFPSLSKTSTLWDIMSEMGPLAHDLFEGKSRYIQMRNALADHNYSLRGRIHEATPSEATERINSFLRSKLFSGSYIDFIDSTFKHNKEAPNGYDWFAQAYNILDLIGFQADPLDKKNNTTMNVRYDGEHAFYAAHCDYLVADDRHFRAKAEVLYHLLDVPVKVIHPKDLITELESIAGPSPEDFVQLGREMIWTLGDGQEVERIVHEEKDVPISVGVKLPVTFLDFFTHGIREEHIGRGQIIKYRKVFKNFSRFLYPIEFESAVRKIIQICGVRHDFNIEEAVRRLMNDESPEPLMWYGKDAIIQLEREEDLWRPMLVLMHAYLPVDEPVVS